MTKNIHTEKLLTEAYDTIFKTNQVYEDALKRGKKDSNNAEEWFVHSWRVVIWEFDRLNLGKPSEDDFKNWFNKNAPHHVPAITKEPAMVSEISADAPNGSVLFFRHLKYDRKPDSLQDVTIQQDVSKWSPEQQHALSQLNTIQYQAVQANDLMNVNGYPPIDPKSQYFVILYNGNYYLVNTEGFSYPRYVLKLVNYKPSAIPVM